MVEDQIVHVSEDGVSSHEEQEHKQAISVIEPEQSKVWTAPNGDCEG